MRGRRWLMVCVLTKDTALTVPRRPLPASPQMSMLLTLRPPSLPLFKLAYRKVVERLCCIRQRRFEPIWLTEDREDGVRPGQDARRRPGLPPIMVATQIFLEGECGIQLLYIRHAIKPRSSRIMIPRQLIMTIELFFFLLQVFLLTFPVCLVVIERVRVVQYTSPNSPRHARPTVQSRNGM